jgi:hypothetical protein
LRAVFREINDCSSPPIAPGNDGAGGDKRTQARDIKAAKTLAAQIKDLAS